MPRVIGNPSSPKGISRVDSAGHINRIADLYGAHDIPATHLDMVVIARGDLELQFEDVLGVVVKEPSALDLSPERSSDSSRNGLSLSGLENRCQEPCYPIFL